jgi:glycosyltransferase involved in cell wall biosynthesis
VKVPACSQVFAPSTEGSKSGSMAEIMGSNSRRVLVAHYVKKGHWGGMARMMESAHAELDSFGWKIEYFTADDLPAGHSERFRRYAFTWCARRHAREAFLCGEPYDIINIHEPSGAALVFGKSRLGSPAIVAMSHGVEQRYWELRLRKNPPSPDPPPLKNRLLFPATSLWQSRLTLCRANHVFCLSEEDKTFLADRFHIQPAGITRVFPGAGPEFSAVAKRRIYKRPCDRLLFLGTWIERKGTRKLIEAYSALAARHPSLQLGILGAGIPEARVLADFPASLHSRITVHSAHPPADCAEVLLDYDVFLLPSFFEGTPLALLEGMSTGMPVVTTATSGMRDVVEDGRNGLLITPGHSEEIVRSVELLLNDSNLRRKLGEQAAKDTAQRYTWRAAAELIHQAYSNLLKSQKGPR